MELCQVVYVKGIMLTMAYPTVTTVITTGFSALNLIAFATNEEYRQAMFAVGPVEAGGVLVADAFAIASTGVRTIQFAAGFLQSQRVFGRVSEIVQLTAKGLQVKYPGALIGVRGSLGRGARFDKDTGGLAPFNKDSWDVDAFIVSDRLAGEVGGRTGFRTAPSLGATEDEIEAALKGLEGYRSTEKRPFTFRVFTTQEWTQKYSKEPFKEVE